MPATVARGHDRMRQASAALLLGLVHAVVDGACGFLIFRDLGHGQVEHQSTVYLVILYNALAFGGQGIAGHLADRRQAYRQTAIAGVLMAALALLLSPRWTVLGIVVIGIANALFHVGAGAQVLRTSADRATESGIFVGPGGIGLCVGIWLGMSQVSCGWVFVALLVLSAPLVAAVSKASSRASSGVRLRLSGPARASFVIVASCAACLLGAVLVRSLVGSTISGTWRGVSTEVVILLAVAACAGNVFGGILGDRFGWTPIAVLSLVLSAPLVSLLVGHVAWALLGMLLFQMIMPVTLKGMHHVLPSRPGLAFGLPCFALLVGALPGLLGHGDLLRPSSVVIGLTVATIVMVVAGLLLLARSGASVGPAGSDRRKLRLSTA